MDNFELKPERKVNRKSLVWNFLTMVVVLGIFFLAYYFLTIFNNPNSPFNPFPPAPLPTLYQTAIPTSTMIPLEATWTPTMTMLPSPSRTTAPTWTLLPQMITPSISLTPVIPTEPTATSITTPMPVSVVITYQASTDFHPDKNCAWLGVAGKVLGTDGKPLQSKTLIQLGGTLDGEAKNLLTLSGSAPAYGQTGFELILSDHPIASSQTLWIQLLDNSTAQPLTNKIVFDTFSECTKNLVMVVFTKSR